MGVLLYVPRDKEVVTLHYRYEGGIGDSALLAAAPRALAAGTMRRTTEWTPWSGPTDAIEAGRPVAEFGSGFTLGGFAIQQNTEGQPPRDCPSGDAEE